MDFLDDISAAETDEEGPLMGVCRFGLDSLMLVADAEGECLDLVAVSLGLLGFFFHLSLRIQLRVSIL